jgi:hypothetical protein
MQKCLYQTILAVFRTTHLSDMYAEFGSTEIHRHPRISGIRILPLESSFANRGI